MVKENKIVIGNDVFGISDRLKAIDQGYFIVFNRDLCRYEVHHRRQRNTLALAVPYPVLDARTVSLTLKTRRENIKRLIAELEHNNEKLEEASDKKLLDNARGRLEEEIGRLSDI